VRIPWLTRWQLSSHELSYNSAKNLVGNLELDDAMNESQTHGLAGLMATIEDRKANPPAKSYTTTLFNGGVQKIGEKITEEAAEVVEAAGEPDEAGRMHLIREAADLIYHLFVMLAHRGVRLSEVEAELARRSGTSGLDEKAARSKTQ
jgi:phosphoribosyl-ATP pyrophosphohydrolase